MGKIKKWIIAAATVTALTIAGYNVGDWNDNKGYPIYNPFTGDTLWFDDSLKVVHFADSVYKYSRQETDVIRDGNEVTKALLNLTVGK